MGRQKLGILALTLLLLTVVAGFITCPVLKDFPQPANRHPLRQSISSKPGIAQSIVPHQVRTGSGGCTAQSPYGFTTINANAQLVASYRELNVCWVRFQVHESDIQTAPGVYNWSRVD